MCSSNLRGGCLQNSRSIGLSNRFEIISRIPRGSSSVSFAYLFLLVFGQIGNIYKVKQDYLYFVLEGAFKGIYLRERNFTLSYVVSEI